MFFSCLFDYIDFTGFLLVFFLFLLLKYIITDKNPPCFPPGPWPLPFMGNIFTGLDFRTIDKLAEEYGDVFSLRWGSEKIVFISGYKMVKEALVIQLDSFADRPSNVPMFDQILNGTGLIISNGYLWKMQRKFANSHLRNFNKGLRGLELIIQEESVYLCDAFKEEQGPFDPQLLLSSAVSNIISSLVFGHRFEYHDKQFQNILQLDSEAIFLSGLTRTQLYNVFPRLFNFVPGPHQKMFANYSKVLEFLNDEINKHKEDLDSSNPRDYIDAYLVEMEKRKSDPEAGFNFDTLLSATLDFFEAGTETSATTLCWGLLFMMKYPEIQRKVQAEIDRVIGHSRLPSMTDRPNMPYTDAVIHETQRLGNIVPLGAPKRACKDTMLGGYFIPKGTTITTSLSSVLKDKNEWETPGSFNPGHFLDEKGQFRKRDAFLPFSAGKRVCLGEQLARMELFLFFTSLLQHFTLTPGPGEKLSLEGQLGFTYAPISYHINVNLR